jgi:hypothetical protein
LIEKRRKAYKNLKTAQDAMIGYRNRYAHEIKFKVGDQVWYKIHVRKTKFDPRYSGPYTVVAIISPVVYVLKQNDGKRFLGHAAYMKLCQRSDTRSTQDQGRLVIDNIDPEYRDDKPTDDHNLMGISLEGEVTVRHPGAAPVVHPNVVRGPPPRYRSAPQEDTHRQDRDNVNARSAGGERPSRQDVPRFRDLLASNFQSRQAQRGDSRNDGAGATAAYDNQEVSSTERDSSNDQRYPRRETRPPFWQTTKEFLMGSTRTRSANYRRNK